VENRPTVFLFNDTQIVDESFLEDINNILSSGEVPNLYKADELDEVCVFSYMFLMFVAVGLGLIMSVTVRADFQHVLFV